MASCWFTPPPPPLGVISCSINSICCCVSIFCLLEHLVGGQGHESVSAGGRHTHTRSSHQLHPLLAATITQLPVLVYACGAVHPAAAVLTLGGASAGSQKTSSVGDVGQNGDRGEMAIFDMELL